MDASRAGVTIGANRAWEVSSVSGTWSAGDYSPGEYKFTPLVELHSLEVERDCPFVQRFKTSNNTFDFSGMYSRVAVYPQMPRTTTPVEMLNEQATETGQTQERFGLRNLFAALVPATLVSAAANNLHLGTPALSVDVSVNDDIQGSSTSSSPADDLPNVHLSFDGSTESVVTAVDNQVHKLPNGKYTTAVL